MTRWSVIAVLFCAGLLGACGGSDSSSKNETTPSATPSAGATGTTGAKGNAGSKRSRSRTKRSKQRIVPAGKGKGSQVGKTTIAKGPSGTVRLTVLAFVPQVPGQGGGGNRIVGVRLAIQNFGPKLYSVDPTRQATLVDSRGGRHPYAREAASSGGGPCIAGPIARPLKVPPGELLQGCMPFALPSAAKAELFEYRLGNNVVRWRLP